MQNDKTTLHDLSIFTTAGEDVASLIDRSTTGAGREALRQHIRNPPETYERLQAMQAVVQWWSNNPKRWTTTISNGTLVLLEKFFETADHEGAAPAGLSLVLGNFLQR